MYRTPFRLRVAFLSLLLSFPLMAQEEPFFDNDEEAMRAEEEMRRLEEMESGAQNNERAAPPRPNFGGRNRFRNRPQGQQQSQGQQQQAPNQRQAAPARPSTPPSRPAQNNRPVTPVKDIEVTKVDKEPRRQISFAEANPEDITDENFPDIIESFNYPNADIMDVANAIGKLTKKNFVIEPGVSGKISIIAPTPVTVAQAWKIFLSALAINDYTIVPTNNGYLKIRKESNAKSDSIETYSGEYFPAADQLITRIVQLKYIQAESVKKSLEKFVSKKAGDVEAYENTNSLIISGYGSSVERISRIIEELDKPGFEERLEVLPIRHAKAKDISELIEKIIKDGEDKKSGSSSASRFARSRFGKQDGGKVENLKLVAPDERTNSIIVVGNKQGIDRIKDLVKRLDYPLDPADAGGVYVYYVKHGEAAKISETLAGVAEDSEKTAERSESKKDSKSSFEAPKMQKPIFGGNVGIKADENTNSLIITASKQDYKVVKSLLAKIDIPKDQVFVEAVIMEMDAINQNNWNMNYMRFFQDESQDNVNTPGQGAARIGFSGGSLNELINPTGGSGAILNLGDPSETIRIQTGSGVIEIPSLIALINFFKTRNNANILSTPNILAMDNEESEIEVGDEVPVGQQQAAFGQNMGMGATFMPQFRDATILLKIKPFISPDSDLVRLNVEQKIQKVSNKPIAAEALAQTTQSLTKKSLKTNIVLQSGQTAVLGGLMEDEDSLEETKVPLLGDIPVLGWLFRNRSMKQEKKNLVVFLTPRIIRNSDQHKQILREKMSERIDWIKRNSAGRDPYGAKFNRMIRESKQNHVFNARDDEDEGEPLDTDEATPLGPEPELETESMDSERL